MTVVYKDVKHVYTCDVAQSDYVFKFKIPTDSDISVSKQLLASPYTLTELVLTTDYTVTGAGDSTGGFISLVTNLTSDYKIILLPAVAYDQQTDYTPYDKFPAVVHENALDKLCIQIKQVVEALNRCVQLDVGQETTVTFNSGESGFFYTDGTSFSLLDEVVTTDLDYNGSFTHGADAAKSATPDIGDQYFATDTNKLYKCTTSNVWNIAVLCSTLDASGNVTISGTTALGDTLDVAGAITAASTLDVTGLSTLASVKAATGATITEFSTDDTLVGDSDSAVPTEQAVKAYVDGIVSNVSDIVTTTLSATATDTTTSATMGQVDFGTPDVVTVTDPESTDEILVFFSGAFNQSSGTDLCSFEVRENSSGSYATVTGSTAIRRIYGDANTREGFMCVARITGESATFSIEGAMSVSAGATLSVYNRTLTVVHIKKRS